MKETYPILEHDYDTQSKLEPSRLIQPRDVPETCAVTFSGDVIGKVVEQKGAKVLGAGQRTEDGRPKY